mmetsp:Transcript_102580/g.289816  ORF Transcript_102580/g.289816 Transcript_102580/m.289816 type:complete len:227 (+) Transcript_102580:854-1534(+)
MRLPSASADSLKTFMRHASIQNFISLLRVSLSPTVTVNFCILALAAPAELSAYAGSMAKGAPEAAVLAASPKATLVKSRRPNAKLSAKEASGPSASAATSLVSCACANCGNTPLSTATKRRPATAPAKRPLERCVAAGLQATWQLRAGAKMAKAAALLAVNNSETAGTSVTPRPRPRRLGPQAARGSGGFAVAETPGATRSGPGGGESMAPSAQAALPTSVGPENA